MDSNKFQIKAAVKDCLELRLPIATDDCKGQAEVSRGKGGASW
jgi:hypothetical protein